MKSMNTISSAAESVDATTPSPAETPNTETTPDIAEQTPADAGATPAAGAQDEASAAAAPETPAQTDAAAPAAPTSARALLKQLQQQFPAFDRKTMRAALGIHTGSMRYLRSMEKATVRYDLDGVAGAEVTDTHRLHAKEQLQQRFKKEADRKKLEKAAAAEAEAARLRQEKLQQLASKFSRG
jgi:ProP effector